ncbi:hypothetical protein [Massilia sp. SYSU DXS3249]
MTIMIVMFSVLALALMAWVLHINSKDRETFEKELEDDLAEDTEGQQ